MKAIRLDYDREKGWRVLRDTQDHPAINYPVIRPHKSLLGALLDLVYYLYPPKESEWTGFVTRNVPEHVRVLLCNEGNEVSRKKLLALTATLLLHSNPEPEGK